MDNRLFELTLRMLRGEGSELPDGMAGALVPCYSAAPDVESAVRRAVAAARSLHLVFDDLQGDVRELPVDRWGEYVARVWPEHAEEFPLPEELPGLVERGAVFFGPFAAFGGQA